MGSDPLKIGAVLWERGMPYSCVSLNEMTQEGVYIISYWNDGAPWNGLHTVAVNYDGKGYTTYNLWGNGSTSDRSPMEYANAYICGYYLG